jgi:hypothetical protein
LSDQTGLGLFDFIKGQAAIKAVPLADHNTTSTVEGWPAPYRSN